jgi:hypothetical protein
MTTVPTISPAQPMGGSTLSTLCGFWWRGAFKPLQEADPLPRAVPFSKSNPGPRELIYNIVICILFSKRYNYMALLLVQVELPSLLADPSSSERET